MHCASAQVISLSPATALRLLQGRGVCSPSRLPTAVVCQAQRGFGSRKRASAKKLKPGTVNTEAQQL